MSTKIYNGYKLPLMSLGSLHELLTGFRDKIKPVKERLLAKSVAKLATDFIDRHAMGDRKLSATDAEDMLCPTGNLDPLIAANDWLDTRRQKVARTKERDNEADLAVDVCLIPTNDKILALLYSERKEYIKIWTDVAGVEPYPYWNNSDEPDGLSWDEWERRGKEWDKALGDGIPALEGLSYDPIANQFPYCSYKDIQQYVPTYQARVDSYTKDKAINDWYEINKAEYKERIFSALMDFNEFSITDEGLKFVAERKIAVEQTLKEHLALDDFKNDIQFEVIRK
jgi:hypothetical protein